MSRFLKSIRTFAAVALAMSAFCLSARAVPIVPNQTLPVTGELDPVGGTILSNGGTQLVSPFSGGAGPTAFSGTLISKVISGDTSNLLGGLTFTYQLTNAQGSSTALSRLTTDNFTGFLTDVSFQTPAGGTIPASVDRNTGAVMGWTYSAVGPGLVNPGATSAVMVVQTNAQSFNSISANVLGGAGATAASFGPVPEPSSFALLALGALALRRKGR